MQKILIPTDFTIESIQVLKEYLATLNTEEHVSIVLCAGYHRSEGFLDLLHFSKHKLTKEFVHKDFSEALAILDNKFGDQIAAINIDFFSGWNLNAFKNYLMANEITQIVFSNEIKLSCKHKKWLDILPFIRKVTTAQAKIKIDKEELPFHQVALAPLFNLVK